MATNENDLRNGVEIINKAGQGIVYRYLSPKDDLDTITALLHEAYAPLAAAGMLFVASYQDLEVTRHRTAQGETIVAVSDGRIVGIITLAEANATHGSPFYDRPDVARFGQFAVQPTHQGRGIGSTLIRFVERRAFEKGLAHVALDTSEHAAELIALYQAKGYDFVEYCQWADVNYRSMIFAKALH